MHSVTSGAVYSALNNQFSVSQVIYEGGGQFSPNSNIPVMGSSGYQLFVISITVPSGYHIEYLLTALIYTVGGSVKIRARLNNIATNYERTWSNEYYTANVCSARFRATDIIQEPVKNYPEQQGTNLYIQTDNGTGYAYIKNVTINVFLIKD